MVTESEQSEIVTVKASPELLAEMRDVWSPPVQVALRRLVDGWEMEFRSHSCNVTDSQ